MDLNCSLKCTDLSSCLEGSILWVKETGHLLLENRVGLKGDKSCISVLTMNLLMGNYRRYTCRFVLADKVKTEVHYTPVFSDSTDWPPLSYILLILRITGLILMISIIAVVSTRTRGS
ncbi:hypothetical protein XENOCAPTIV_022385 [Xenoophorus captivus]|uniref:Ig-like domain-containing protein n=1 Tax=Xenoophorus captivus TaxID=1517983 RepID=A0ABV0S1R4_9TELE